MSPPPLPDTRTLLANLNDWYSRLPVQRAEPLTGPTHEADALLHGRRHYEDETLFLYGYTVGSREHCFFYDTPWDERTRVPRPGALEWYDGLDMPRPFRVRYSVSHPDRHEILDPRLGEMMKRPLHRVGTRPSVAHPLTASAKEVLEQIDRWDERLGLLRRSQFLTPMNAREVPGWLPARARFGDVVGTGDASYVSYEFEAGPIRYVFAVNLTHPFSRMTPSDHSPQASRAERRAHLREIRGKEQGLRALAGTRDVGVRFNPEDPGQHSLELPTADSYMKTYQLEPLAFPRSDAR
jgi:hypothetical protein